MTVRVYRWDDASAPSLSSAAGSVPALLKACLVTGYGAKAAAGWSNPFSGTNIEAFRNGTGSSQLYLRVAQTETGPARVVGYESMTDVNTGTAAFPTEAQVSGGLYLPPSSSADATARPWILVATEKCFYLWVGYDRTTAQGVATVAYELAFFAGDIKSNKVGDAYPFLIIAHASATVSSSPFGTVSTNFTAVAGHYLARAVAQTGGSVAAGKIVNHVLNGSYAVIGGGASSLAYPDPASGGINLMDVVVHEATAIRGVMPGLWAPAHNLPGNPGDTFSGRGALAGKTFLLLDAASGSNRGRIVLETSDTW